MKSRNYHPKPAQILDKPRATVKWFIDYSQISDKELSAQNVSISKGNSKMNQLPNVAHSVESCINKESCIDDCYGEHGNYNMPSPQNALNRNYQILKRLPEKFFGAISLFIKKHSPAKFRFDTVGDTISHDHAIRLVAVAEEYQETRFLKYTKAYRFWKNKILPKNFSVLFSWFVKDDSDKSYKEQVEMFRNHSQDFPMAIVAKQPIKLYEEMRSAGMKPVFCPAQLFPEKIGCSKCNLCYDASARGIDIVFAMDDKKNKDIFRNDYKIWQKRKEVVK